MFILLSLTIKPGSLNNIYLLAATILSIPLLGKVKKSFFLRLLARRLIKKGRQQTKGGRLLFGLLLSLGTGGLIGLFFGWSIGLWVAIGLGIIMFIYFLSGEKTPKTRKTPLSKPGGEWRYDLNGRLYFHRF